MTSPKHIVSVALKVLLLICLACFSVMAVIIALMLGGYVGVWLSAPHSFLIGLSLFEKIVSINLTVLSMCAVSSLLFRAGKQKESGKQR